MEGRCVVLDLEIEHRNEGCRNGVAAAPEFASRDPDMPSPAIETRIPDRQGRSWNSTQEGCLFNVGKPFTEFSCRFADISEK